MSRSLFPGLQSWLRSPHILFGLAVLVLLALATVAARTVVIDHLLERSNRYGQAMADIAAKRAIDATLNHDLVSLQVILQDVAANPDVAQASIFDVENNLLVQSGQQRTNLRRDYIAAITLQDSIAGYVAVGLTAEGQFAVVNQLYGLFALLAALILAFTMIVAYRQRESGGFQETTTIPIVENPGRDSTQKPSTGTGPLSKVELLLYFPVLAQLQRQLNNARFNQFAQQLDQHISAVASLYSGRLLVLEVDQARIGFSALTANSECAFNGLCCAHLLQKLAQLNDFSLPVSAAVYRTPPECTATDAMLQRQRIAEMLEAQSTPCILIANTLASERNLAERVVTRTDSADSVDAAFVVVEDFRNSYRSLLEQQLHQLNSEYR